MSSPQRPGPSSSGPPDTARVDGGSDRDIDWDIVCRVVDNFGDAAVLWRLARQLAAEYRIRPRLYIDAPAVLERLVPGARPGQVVDGVRIERLGDDSPIATGAAVVLTGFLARLPAPARARLAGQPDTLLLQLEYLSAEPWVDGVHRLPSIGPDGVIEHFFYPGFTERSGGLIREHDLLARRDAFQADPTRAARLLAGLGLPAQPPGTRIGSLFSYPGPPLLALADALAASDDLRLTLIAPGLAAPSAGNPSAGPMQPPDPDPALLAERSAGRLTLAPVRFLSQCDYDRLLWSCDLNLVRGEDSWIRALWAGQPMLWQAYRQADGTHKSKVDAFLDRLGEPAAAPDPVLAAATRWWNAPDPDAAPMLALLRALPAARAAIRQLVDRLAGPAGARRDDDLASRLLAFALEKRSTPRYTRRF